MLNNQTAGRMCPRAKRFIHLILTCVLLLSNVPSGNTQHFNPAVGFVNPYVGWSWKKIEFESIDPEKTRLFLHYQLQPKKDAPSVIIGHDNGGISDNEIEYAKYLYNHGFHVFLADRITSRKRVAKPFELFLVEDQFATVAFVKDNFSGSINDTLLSYASFSGDGGLGGLMAIEPVVREKLAQMSGLSADSFKYKSVVTIYPHCFDLVGRSPDTPTLIIGAELDGSDPVVCRNVYEKFQNITVDIYLGATHGFDQATLQGKGRIWIKKPVRMPGTCVFLINPQERADRDNSRYFLLMTPNGIHQRTRGFGSYIESCATKDYGYWATYDAALTKKAFDASVAFMRR